VEKEIKEKILWATDLSKASLLALASAHMFRKIPKQTLVALHVVENPLDPMYKPEETTPPYMVEHAVGVAREKLRKVMSRCGFSEALYECEIAVEVGAPEEKIMEVAEREKVWMILMAKETKGLGKLLGSVSEYVLGKAKCPVLIVGIKVDESWLNIHHILEEYE
jgi:nucleotide-binding universal stress UspA family protein